MALAPHPLDALHAPGLPPDRVQSLIDHAGLPAWIPAGKADGARRVMVLLDGLGAVGDTALWAPPFTAWVEAEQGAAPAAVMAAMTRAANADIFASLSTATANEVHLAGRIVSAITTRRPLEEAQRDDMELALHEAISNAVVHGNLQVAGMKGLSVDALDRFSLALAARMADPAFAGRRVEVACWLEPNSAVIEVSDEGSGFERAEKSDHKPDASGRGLDLIAVIAQSIELLDHGRRIRMRFCL